ncbi:hypothetical protein GJ496_005683 [Pomphorhynchus laevis]|nr:hypothetical protein GJ496_005683 [Pomphorhynchus laevis]
MSPIKARQRKRTKSETCREIKASTKLNQKCRHSGNNSPCCSTTSCSTICKDGKLSLGNLNSRSKSPTGRSSRSRLKQSRAVTRKQPRGIKEINQKRSRSMSPTMARKTAILEQRRKVRFSDEYELERSQSPQEIVHSGFCCRCQTKRARQSSGNSYKQHEFTTEPMGEKPVNCVAGIGYMYGEKLCERGFDKAIYLLGVFLALEKNEEVFKEWLMKTVSMTRPHACMACDSLKKWCNNFIN